MAKRKSTRGSAVIEVEEERYTFSSGVEVVFRPFPLGLKDKIEKQAKERFTKPIPPKQEIEVADGKEVIDNEDDPDYLTALFEYDNEVKQYVAEKITYFTMEFCVEILDWEEVWKKKLPRIKHYIDFPEDGDEEDIKICFLESFAVTSERDYNACITIPLSLSLIDNSEVSKRIESFRSNMAGAESTEDEAPGFDGIKQVEI